MDNLESIENSPTPRGNHLSNFFSKARELFGSKRIPVIILSSLVILSLVGVTVVTTQQQTSTVTEATKKKNPPKKKTPKNNQPNKGGKQKKITGNAVLWVEDNNLGRSGGMPNDALAMYTTRRDEWNKTRNVMSVYMYRFNTLKNESNGYTDEYMRTHMMPLLRSSGIQIALNVSGATWAQCGNRDQIMLQEAAFIEKIHSLGGRVQYLALQSALSKPSDSCPNYGIDKRVQDVVRYSKYMKDRFPGIQIGIFDATVAHNEPYEKQYKQLVNTLRNHKTPLDFIMLDFPIEKADKNWKNLLDAEKFIKNNLHVKFGVTMTSTRGGRKNAKTFHENVRAGYRGYKNAGGNANMILIAAWFPYPKQNLPEQGATYTYMKTVLDIYEMGGIKKDN